MKDLRGRVCVVTGAASGIGIASARRLREAGARVALLDREWPAGAEFEENDGFRRYVADVRDPEAMRTSAAWVERDFGRADVLVNNAGVALLARFEDVDLEDFRWLMDVNFWGVVHGCRAFLPLLRVRERAHIVNVSSIFGLVAVPGQGAYAASKAAIASFSESLAQELMGSGVDVSVVFPAGVRTQIARRARAHSEAERARAVELLERAGTSADAIATAIVDAIRRRRHRVVVGPGARSLDRMKRIAPVAVSSWAARIDRRLAR